MTLSIPAVWISNFDLWFSDGRFYYFLQSWIKVSINGHLRNYEESRVTKYPSPVGTDMCRALDLSDRSIQWNELWVLTADTPHSIPVASLLCLETMIESKWSKERIATYFKYTRTRFWPYSRHISLVSFISLEKVDSLQIHSVWYPSSGIFCKYSCPQLTHESIHINHHAVLPTTTIYQTTSD